jgi:hypothetical protein
VSHVQGHECCAATDRLHGADAKEELTGTLNLPELGTLE